MNATSAYDFPTSTFPASTLSASTLPAALPASTLPAALPATPSIVSTQWLCDHLGSDTMIVLDASPASASYRRAHIPTALFADLAGDVSDPAGDEPYARPSAARFAEAIERLGIGPETTVVVYDTDAGQEATRFWWLFRSFGFDRVSVLNGGFAKWNAEDRPVE